MALLGAVTPRNSGEEGGFFGAAGNPVAVPGQFTSVGAASAPPNVTAGAAAFARNNRGSNITIPYARLVPLTNEAKHAGRDANGNMMTYDQKLAHPNQYDGLVASEVAWIKGRPGVVDETDYSGMHARTLGFGPNRMQRLCTTSWLMNDVASTERKLVELTLRKPEDPAKSDPSNKLHGFLRSRAPRAAAAAADPLYCMPDRLTYPSDVRLELAEPAKVPTKRFVGLNLQPPGPFLCSYADTACGKDAGQSRPLNAQVKIGVKLDFKDEAIGRRDYNLLAEKVPRDALERLAFVDLNAALAEKGLFTWTPDGVTLSKLESPADDALASGMMDAREGALYNVAVQGPAITKTWCNSIDLPAHPLDKLMFLLVGTVVIEQAPGNLEKVKTFETNYKQKTKADAPKATVEELLSKYDTGKKIGPLQQSYYYEWALKPSASRIKTLVNTAESTPSDANKGKVAAGVTAPATNCQIVNFRLVRATSSSLLEEFPARHGLRNAAFVSSGSPASLKTSIESEIGYIRDKLAADEKGKALKVLKHCSGVNDKDAAAVDALLDELMTNKKYLAGTNSDELKEIIKTVNSLGVLAQANVETFYDGTTAQAEGFATKVGDDDVANTEGVLLTEYVLGGWSVGSVIDSSAARAALGRQALRGHATNFNDAVNVNVNVEWMTGSALRRQFYTDAPGGIAARGTIKRSSKDMD